ncbi:uncharacterized protein [Diadema setosum]|uniref:uncharacterized protein n=1 Tax=Diadema setosum TaxID=31175 RepID=UPI003B3A6E9F
MAFIRLETKAKMIDFLVNTPPEDWPMAHQNQDKENFAQVKEDLKKAKREAEHVEERLSDLIETTQDKVEELEQKKKEAEEALLRVENKKAKLETLKGEIGRAMSGLEGVDMEGMDVETKLQKQRETLQTSEMALERCELILSEHKGALSRLTEDIRLAQAIRKECQDMVTTLRVHKTSYEEKRADEHAWFNQCLHSLRQISGVSELRVDDQTVTLDLVSKSSVSPVKAQLKMQFACPPNSSKSCSLVSAELAHDILDCRDVIKECVTTNDPVLLITEVKRRLNSHAPVLQEVEELRNQYAIDYVHGEGVLRAMLGSSGQVVCTLTIESGYPSRGCVTLTKIEGNGHHKDVSEYKPPTDNPTMQDWLVYLQDHL